jgi:ubiquinone/menaquinone biosynthesis C-methylase UbiE
MSLIPTPCKVCDADDADFLFEKSGWTIVRCRHCGFVYTNPIPTRKSLQEFYSSGIRVDRKEKNPECIERFSAEAGRGKYSQMKRIKSPIGRIWVRKARLIRWNRYLPQNGRFLDVGCAQGHLVIAAKGMEKWDCSGVDIQMHKLRHARISDPDADVCLAAVDELSFKDKAFDIVTMTHVLEHMFDPLRTLLELSRIIRRKGVLVITVPNIGHTVARLLGKKWRSVNPPGHLWYFSPSTLERLVRKAGMEVIHNERLLLRCNMTVFARQRI